MQALLAEPARRSGTAIVVVTHNPALAAQADRVLVLDGGVLRRAEGAELVGAE